jgi:hypothetical protein
LLSTPDRLITKATPSVSRLRVIPRKAPPHPSSRG